MVRATPILIASLALTPSFAGAAPEPAGARVAPAPAPELTSWYGYQILLADAATLGLGLAAESPELLLAGYLAGPIIIHAVHRRKGLAALSPMMRLFLPALGIGIGTQFKTCNANGDECEMGGLFYGGGIGVATALILDWGLGWEKSAPPPEPPRGFAVATAGVRPSGDGFTFVLGGTF
jgi:hypothetical protein